MNKKMELTTIGYSLTMVNILLTLNGYNVLGIVFGLVAVVYFVKAIGVKQCVF